MLKHVQVLIPCNLGHHHWVLASVDLSEGKIYLLDLFRQEVTWDHMNKQVACLRWFIPSMLNQVGFHNNRREEDPTYRRSKRPFRMSIVVGPRVPQQQKGYECFKSLFYPNWFESNSLLTVVHVVICRGNCSAHTLRLAKYLLANMREFD